MVINFGMISGKKCTEETGKYRLIFIPTIGQSFRARLVAECRVAFLDKCSSPGKGTSDLAPPT